jgi:carbon-monoxide dehydrogenase medium subunit
VKPPRFDYHAPATVEEVLGLLADSALEARVLAGGQSLVPMMNFRIATPSTLVDLRRVTALRSIAVEDDGTLVIGAGVTQARALRDPVVRAGWPLLTDALGHIGHPQVRGRGTVCGSIAHHDPVAEVPAVTVALDATIVALGPQGRREIPAADFFVSYYETVLRADELLTEVRFPRRPAGEGHSFQEVARKHGDYALVGAAALVRRDGLQVTAVRLVVLGVDQHARRFPDLEDLLVGEPFDAERTARVLAEIGSRVEPMEDNRASSDYRRQVAIAVAAETVTEAWERADD